MNECFIAHLTYDNGGFTNNHDEYDDNTDGVEDTTKSSLSHKFSYMTIQPVAITSESVVEIWNDSEERNLLNKEATNDNKHTHDIGDSVDIGFPILQSTYIPIQFPIGYSPQSSQPHNSNQANNAL
ncbi:hypothetical protein BJ944DRAFT_237163 [Cunninghamella echinulata]|nr:hypothetical protein BJ944DRAFT_237163 [Cunninghamella echinulata]